MSVNSVLNQFRGGLFRKVNFGRSGYNQSQ